MNEIDKAREAAISTFKNKYPRVIGDAPYAPQVVNAFEEGYDAGYATATAKIEQMQEILKSANIEILEDGSHRFKPKAVKYYCGEVTARRITELEKQVAQQIAHIQRLEKGLEAVEMLIDNSSGVAGLHLNGDVASWSSLRRGGIFETWLLDFDKAIEPKDGE